MLELIKSYLKSENIYDVSCLSLDECTITRPYLLDRHSISSGSVIIFAVPYLTRDSFEKRNVSSYAVSRDYHLFFERLFEKLLPILKERYPDSKFAAFSDHSPINEIEAAALAGLGMIGQNHLLITEKYSSFVFLGEIITDEPLPSLARTISSCEDCGRCRIACPVELDTERCLSSLTQKKGALTTDEINVLKKHGSAWGCDLCQYACPHTQAAIKNGTVFTSVKFFSDASIPYITSSQVLSLSDAEFNERAYSWRGRKTVLRNLLILEGKDDTGDQKGE